jgi:hypothetical protein
MRSASAKNTMVVEWDFLKSAAKIQGQVQYGQVAGSMKY